MILAVALQVASVLAAAVSLGLWVSPFAAVLLVSAVVFYVGLELERR